MVMSEHVVIYFQVIKLIATKLCTIFLVDYINQLFHIVKKKRTFETNIMEKIHAHLQVSVLNVY